MADIRIKDLAAGTGLVDDTDFVVMDSTADGTRKLTVAELRNALLGPVAARSIDGTVITITGEDASAGAVVLEAADASSTIQLKVSGTVGLETSGLATSVTGFLVATRNLLLTSPSVKTATYTITREDLLIRVDSGGGAFNLELPSPALCNRWHFIVKDVDGSLATNAVTVVRFGSEQIEGVAADYALQADYGSWHFWCDGTDWWVIG